MTYIFSKPLHLGAMITTAAFNPNPNPKNQKYPKSATSTSTTPIAQEKTTTRMPTNPK